MQVGPGFWASKTLPSALEMEVFTELAKHPEDLNTLQGRVGLHPRSARDFLDTLVALGFLKREDGKYHNTPETALFLDKNKASYIGGILEMANHRLYSSWGHLTEALRTGEQQNESKGGGKGLFEALYESIIDDDRSQNAFGLLMSLNMLIETDGGFDYTGADCMGWMQDAGFREKRVEHLVGPDSMAIAVK
jgi:hypothetical protein